MNTTATAAVLDNVDALDPFTTNSTTVQGSNLREGMVLMDPDLNTPAAWLDHRVRSTKNSGEVAFMAHDLEDGRFIRVSIHRNATVAVLAR